MGNKYKDLVSNTLIFAIGSFGSKLIAFFLVPLYTNYMTTDQFGIADFVISCSNLLLPIISLVIQDSVLRFGLSKDADHNKIAKNVTVVFIGGTVFTFLTIPLINLYGPLSEWRWYFCAYVIATNAANIMYSYAKSIDKNKLYAISSLLNALILATVNILLLTVFSCGIGGYLLANILANAIPAIMIFFATGMPKRIKKAKIDWQLLKSMLAYSIPLIANNLSWWVLNSSNRIVIEHFLSASDVGLFTAASKIPSLLSIVTTIFSSAWSISSVKEYESDCSKQFFTNVFNAFSIVMFIGASFIILVIKPFMSIYVGADFFSSWILVPLLVYGIVLYSFSTFFGAIYGMVKKNIAVTVTTIIAAIVNLLLSIVLIPQIGLFGAAIATMAGYFAIGIIRMIHSRKYLKFDYNKFTFFVSMIILLAQVIMVSFEIHVYLVSACALALLLIVNLKEIKAVCSMILKTLKKRGLDR